MDKHRRRYLKKFGSKLVKDQLEKLQKIMQESNPTDISDPQWAKNYKEINQLQKKYNNNRNEVYTKYSEGLDFIAQTVEINLSKEYTPIQTYYLHCKKCGAFVPMNPEISIKCFCNSVLLDLKGKRKYIDLSNVNTVKLIAKCRPKFSNLTGYLKKLINIFKQRKSTLNIHEVDSINELANKLMKEGRKNELESSLEKINP